MLRCLWVDLLFFAFFAFTGTQVAQANTVCERILLDRGQQAAQVKMELYQVRHEAPLFHRLLLKAMNRALVSRSMRACERRGACTRQDVAHAVRESVDGLSGDLRLARGYAIILGAWAGGLGFATYLNTIKEVQVYAPLTALITGVGLSWISAPIVDRVSSKVRRGVYSLLGLEGAQGARNVSDGQMESYYLRTQATIGPLAQIGGQRLNQFLDSLDKKASDARVSLKAGERALAIDQLAEITVRMREIFPDVQPDQRAVARVVRTSFLEHIEASPEVLGVELLARIRQLDPEAGVEGPALEYYQAALRAWLTPVSPRANESF